ncbi:MAG: phospholipase D family protein [Betaproteobacteria bacterium]
MSLLEERGLRVLAIAVLAAFAGCASLPSLDGRIATTASIDTTSTRLGRAVAPDAAAHRGRSGVHALPTSGDAFAARVLLADAAEATLDAQYYIWHDDATGTLMMEALWRAAGRGVRVRMLVDDFDTSGLDERLATLDAHRNIEVRLYNPFAHRGMRSLDFAADFGRVNRRMHNKSFTVDNQATIVGGRNIGDEYFGAGEGVEFTDLDVVAIGPVVREVSAAFDLYWNSASAYPAAALLPAPSAGARTRLENAFAATRLDPEAMTYLAVLRDSQNVRDLVAGRLPLEWTDVRVVYDDPRKTLDASDDRQLLLLASLLPAVGRPERSFDLVSPYFVPAENGTAALVALARRGVQVRILTNSLAATDVGPVHAGYAKRREALLRAGVRLYEFKPDAAPPPTDAKKGFGGSGAASLHAKTFAIDGKRIFVGSFNFDPRSARLNTEMGVVIESEALAGKLGRVFDTRVATDAYEVRLRDDGAGLEWIDRSPAGEVRHLVEPGTTAWRRAWIRSLELLPIDWLL